MLKIVSGLVYFGIHFLLVLVLKEHLQGNTVLQQWNIVEGFNINSQ